MAPICLSLAEEGDRFYASFRADRLTRGLVLSPTLASRRQRTEEGKWPMHRDIRFTYLGVKLIPTRMRASPLRSMLPMRGACSERFHPYRPVTHKRGV